jgi:hypothetical protein
MATSTSAILSIAQAQASHALRPDDVVVIEFLPQDDDYGADTVRRALTGVKMAISAVSP